MKLNEVLDRPYPWIWKNKNFKDGGGEAEFKADTQNYAYIINKLFGDEKYEIFFKNKSSRGDHYGIGKTKTGDEFKVFATVLDITKDFIKKVKPKIIEFSSKGSSRGELYKKLIKKFAIRFGYKIRSIDDNSNVLYFTLERIK